MSFNVSVSLKAVDLLTKCANSTMQDFSSIVHICHYALETQALDGDIVEFGCYKGDTAKLLSFISNKSVFVYDSFEGIPDSEEGLHLPGTMKVAEQELINNFISDNVPLPTIKRGWFGDIKPTELPNKISFAHLDGDLYISTIQSLNLIYNRLVPGAVILIDDYNEQQYWPGVKKAIDEFFKDKPEKAVELSGIKAVNAFKAVVKKL